MLNILLLVEIRSCEFQIYTNPKKSLIFPGTKSVHVSNPFPNLPLITKACFRFSKISQEAKNFPL